MTRTDFWTLCDQARGDPYLSGNRYGRRMFIYAGSNGGFADGKDPVEPSRRTLELVGVKRYAEMFAKYQTWLEQWKEKKNEQSPARGRNRGGRVAPVSGGVPLGTSPSRGRGRGKRTR